MNKDKIQKQINELDLKLNELRAKWKIASPGMKKWIEAGAKSHKHSKELLERRLRKLETNSLFET